MFVRTTWTHVKFLLGKTSSKITFFVLFLVMLMTFVSNVLDFRGYDVIEMFHPMNILSLSYDRTAHNAGTALLLVQLLPLLVGWPAGLALAADRGLGTDTMLVARLGRKLYVTSKLTAVFIATAIVFSVPFLLEIVLNCLSFPLTATGNLIRIDAFDSDYADIIGNYLCPWLYRFSPYLAAVFGTIGFGLFAGLLACVTASLSLFVRIRFRVFLLLPVFILLYAITSLESIELAWYNYIFFFSDAPKIPLYWFSLCAALVCFCVAAAWYGCRKDCLK
ncbi:MAG: hypothetical protein MSC54_07210 [Clostridiales bacterium]|nr:hypothetical protein [Clostridiales bacterium]